MADSQQILQPDPPSQINWKFIWEKEGGVLTQSYIPAKTSGVTVGPGFDIGQHTTGEIDKLNISDSLKTKLKSFAAYGPKHPRDATTDPKLSADFDAIYAATQAIKDVKKEIQKTTKEARESKRALQKAEQELKKTTAAHKDTQSAMTKVDEATKKLNEKETSVEQTKETLKESRETLTKAKKNATFAFTLTPEETEELTNAVIEDKQPKFIATYNESVEKKEAEAKAAGQELKLKRFDELPESVQTAIASFQFNRGEKRGITGNQAEKAFWNAVVEQKDWNEAAKLLKATHNNKGYLKTRRTEEADYLIQNLPKEEKIEGKDQSLNDLDPNRLRVAQNEDGKIKSTKDQDLLNSQVKTAFAMQPSKNQDTELQYWKERFGSDDKEEDKEENVKIKI
ncbi:MAG: pesticin C-terminus-like muramidase [Verrucomicrobiia bacterium]